MTAPDRLTVYRSRTLTGQRWRWRLVSGANGRTVGASSEAYRERADCIVNAARVLGIPGSILCVAATGDEPLERMRPAPPAVVRFEGQP